MQAALFKTREEECLMRATWGNATDIVAVDDNAGANYYKLQVAAGHLQLMENRLHLDINRGCENKEQHV